MSSGTLYNKVQLSANFNRYSPKSVVFIQDYLYKALEAKNIKLADIDAYIDSTKEEQMHNGYKLSGRQTSDIVNITDDNGRTDKASIGSSFFQNLTTSMSKLDIADFVLLNEMMASYLKVGNYTTRDVGEFYNCRLYTNFMLALTEICAASGTLPNPNKGIEDILALYHSDNVSPDSIIMNKTPVYKLVPTHHTLFVVVYSGFTNVLVEGTNDSKLRRYFIRSLMSGLFRFSSIEEALDHPLFDTFAIQFFIDPTIDSKPIDFTNYKTES